MKYVPTGNARKGLIEAIKSDDHKHLCELLDATPEVKCFLRDMEGKSRVRTLEIEGLASHILDAWRHGKSWTHYGKVPGSYGHPFMATHCVAWRDGGRVMVGMHRVNNTSGPSSMGCPLSPKRRELKRHEMTRDEIEKMTQWALGAADIII